MTIGQVQPVRRRLLEKAIQPKTAFGVEYFPQPITAKADTKEAPETCKLSLLIISMLNHFRCALTILHFPSFFMSSFLIFPSRGYGETLGLYQTVPSERRKKSDIISWYKLSYNCAPTRNGFATDASIYSRITNEPQSMVEEVSSPHRLFREHFFCNFLELRCIHSTSRWSMGGSFYTVISIYATIRERVKYIVKQFNPS